MFCRIYLAIACQIAGDLRRAIPLHEYSLPNFERFFGSDHPLVMASRTNLATGYQTVGDRQRVIPQHQDTLASREQVLGTDHPYTRTPRANLNLACQAAGLTNAAGTPAGARAVALTLPPPPSS